MVTGSAKSAPMPPVAVIMVNWNGWELTLEAYKSILDSEYENINILIVENGSTDNSLERLQEFATKARIIVSDTNRGFAGGCNLGIEVARDLGCEYIYLLNNDAVVDVNTIFTLV